MTYKSIKNWQNLRRFLVMTGISLLVVLGIGGIFPATVPVATLAQPAKADDVVISWNTTAVAVTQQDAPLQARALGIVHGAVFDAVNSIDRRYTPYLVDTNSPGASKEAAVSSAAHTVLLNLYPAQQARLDKALSDSLSKIEDGNAKTDGINLGKEVAEKILEIRSKDGWDAKGEYKAEKAAGIWEPTPPGYVPAVFTQWRNLKPFTFLSPNQFTTPAPLAWNSEAYAKELNEVKNIGSKDSKTRTPDQTATAIFWTVNTPVIWNAAARSAAIARRNSTIDNARLFALVNFAISDAYVAGYSVKYKYNYWRPVTAIRNAEAAGIRGVITDANWESLIITPAHPDYISGHSVTSGAAEKVLQNFFSSDDLKFSFTYPAGGVTRSYSSFSQLSNENVDARVWGGVHTRNADVQGTNLGYQVADYAFRNYLKPIK
ncbi:PAP2 superfamily protein [Synechococcus sp. PCC 7502]|uniref:vanadium-dependent haloperoxidase n=1 Tax=Synechococcus sp. PCC 7502 TaxID=1173263 RepID=UPI00029FEE57|nr:vanadium-dependent haloperoxidase [Synechococcus sp. PCC 7502]AFY72488.1 PAP2 superfamily protein [Synechococcus sp. PCC 7502]